jgi:hypothetical protein
MKSSQTFLRKKRRVCRGERMRKVLIFLLVIGFLMGTFAVVEEVYLGYSFQEDIDFSGDEEIGNGFDDIAPCGGGGDGGSPTPG